MTRRSRFASVRYAWSETPHLQGRRTGIGPGRVTGRGLCLLLLLALLAVPSTAVAEEAAERLRDAYLLNGRLMRRAFREVISEPRAWTVELLHEDKPVALGTVVEQDGWIITKASQAKNAELCRLPDGRKRTFETVGIHPGHDLALIKVDVSGLTPVVWETDEPEVGAWLVTVGRDPTPVAVGVMSVPRREIPRSEIHGVLGVELELEREQAAKVHKVFSGTGAFVAGIREGDVIVEVDKHGISDSRQLIRTIRQYRPGDTLSVKIQRNEEEVTFSVTLSYPPNEFLSRIAIQNQMGGELSFRRDEFEAVYQHDTVLSPEECGGPVVTLSGQAVGINIARGGRTESYTLPADLILSVLEEMKSGAYPPASAKELASGSGVPAESSE
jgi:serine protease Do